MSAMIPGDKHLFGGKSPVALPWEPLPHMQEWLDEKEAQETTATYLRAAKAGLARFAAFAATEGIRHPDEIQRHHILRFQVHLASLRKIDGTPFKKSYRNQLMKYLRNWINWLAESEYITTSPWVRIRVDNVEKTPKPLEEDEIALLFDAHRRQAFSISPFFYHRREAMLVLLYGWGLRLNELQSLTTVAMDMRLEWVTVRNKARAGSLNDSKTLPYSQEIKLVMQRWLMNRSRYAVAGEDALFIDQNGHGLSTHLIRKIITELGTRAGVSINPHRLRDTFGTTMLDNDVPVERIQKMMGHSSRSQTLAYARVNDKKIQESHEAVINPLLHRLLNGELP